MLVDAMVEPAADSTTGEFVDVGEACGAAPSSLEVTPGAPWTIVTSELEGARDVESATEDDALVSAPVSFEPRAVIGAAWTGAGVPGTTCAPASSMVLVTTLFEASFFEVALASLCLDVVALDAVRDSLAGAWVSDEDPATTLSPLACVVNRTVAPVPRAGADDVAPSGGFELTFDRALATEPAPRGFWLTCNDRSPGVDERGAAGPCEERAGEPVWSNVTAAPVAFAEESARVSGVGWSLAGV